MDFQAEPHQVSFLSDHNYSISCESPRANGLISEQMQPFDEVILDFMKEQDIPGASVAISRGGALIYCQVKYKIERDM